MTLIILIQFFSFNLFIFVFYIFSKNVFIIDLLIIIFLALKKLTLNNKLNLRLSLRFFCY